MVAVTSGQVDPKWQGLGRLSNKQFFVGSSYKKYAIVATVALLAGLASYVLEEIYYPSKCY
ncbi:hypothetical protein GOQ29_00140 [Clostridium sp. D2Q-14]|uniref:hypothetical protein n=1 Tax=Anaeromonas gelatinilytica TaxID=2683194 RepID=UPI00193B1B2C|nr:hypothetical protein [Anaeromonas gelatinilytica]MBS4534025.1 hypothetical protein [Anaeromonas gelatinilytica]